MDMTMPTSQGFWDANLTVAVRNGSIPEARITDMATRLDFVRPGEPMGRWLIAL
jgi:hypothetical protein